MVKVCVDCASTDSGATEEIAKQGTGPGALKDEDAVEVLEALGVGSAVGIESRRPLIGHHLKNLPQIYPHLNFYFQGAAPLTLANLLKAPEALVRVRDEKVRRKITGIQ